MSSPTQRVSAIKRNTRIEIASPQRSRSGLPKRFLHFDLRRFDVRAIRRFSAPPFAHDPDAAVVVRSIGQDFRFVEWRCQQNRCRSSGMKNEHYLRCARFAGIQTYSADMIELAAASAGTNADRSRLRSFRFATARDYERNRNCGA